MAQTVVTVSSLVDAKTNRGNRDTNAVAFQVDARISLREAVQMKDNTRARLLGYRVMNPELLDYKSRTKTTLEREPIRRCSVLGWNAATRNCLIWSFTLGLEAKHCHG